MLTNSSSLAGKRLTYRPKIKVVLTLLLVVAVIASAQAQGGLDAGRAAIDEARGALTDYFDPASLLMYAAGAIAGLVGGFKVFTKWNSGDQDAQKSAMSWIGSCIFLVASATVLRAFFL